MTARRKVAAIASVGIAPLALAALGTAPAAAHGSMTDPVSRVSACYAEGPESPRSAACKAAVAASGTQAFYDWNEVNIGDAAGRHRELIPDGKLCSAGRDKYQGLDLPRADWPSSKLTSGQHSFRYKGTAPHKGSFELYITKDGYDPTKPLKWSDLEEKPFAKVTNPAMDNGDYVFDGAIPDKSGRHLIYSIWQRSDSPEAFYTCSDVVFGKDSGGDATAPAPTASAPNQDQIDAGSDKSSVDHDGHGGNTGGDHSDHNNGEGTASKDAKGAKDAKDSQDASSSPQARETRDSKDAASADEGNQPKANGASEQTSEQPAEKPTTTGVNLAETGSDSSTSYLAVGGAATLAVGAAILFATVRRRATATGRGSR